MKTCSCSCHNTMNNFLIKDKDREKEKKIVVQAEA